MLPHAASVAGQAYDNWGAETWSSQTWSFCAFRRGDANGDGVIALGDAIYLLNYLFRNGDPPDPLGAGDANCDETVELGDAICLLNYLFRGGDPPSCQHECRDESSDLPGRTEKGGA
jgi:hypothetical protein